MFGVIVLQTGKGFLRGSSCIWLLPFCTQPCRCHHHVRLWCYSRGDVLVLGFRHIKTICKVHSWPHPISGIFFHMFAIFFHMACGKLQMAFSVSVLVVFLINTLLVWFCQIRCRPQSFHRFMRYSKLGIVINKLTLLCPSPQQTWVGEVCNGLSLPGVFPVRINCTLLELIWLTKWHLKAIDCIWSWLRISQRYGTNAKTLNAFFCFY